MTLPPDPDATSVWGADDPDVERTQVLDTRAFQAAPTPAPAPAAAPVPVAVPVAAPPAYRPSEGDVARRDHRGTVEWDLQVARANNRPSTDLGLLLLRLFSLPLVLRGLHKVLDHGAFIESLRANSFAAQAPELIGTLVIAGEIALPVLLAIGLATRLAGALQAAMVIGIFVLWTLAGGALFDPATGGLAGEPELLFAGLSLPLLFTGAGRISIDRVLTAAGRERRIEKRVARRIGE